jgi:hypothetical protein
VATLGADMIVNVTVLSTVTRNDLSIQGGIVASNGATAGGSQPTGLQANVQTTFTFVINLPSDLITTGAAHATGYIYQNNPWTQLAKGADVPFTVQAPSTFILF